MIFPNCFLAWETESPHGGLPAPHSPWAPHTPGGTDSLS